MRRWKFWFVPVLGLMSLQAFAGCYTVYDRVNRILYQSDKPPVDMSLPLHDTIPARFPGGSLVFDTEGTCPVVSPVAMGNGGPITRTSSPLLTDEGTARRLGLPHRKLGENVAVVAPAAVAMEPGVTVVPAGTAVASKSPRTDTVISEYRNPPVTVTRRGEEVIVSDNR
jgi:hypothetical protein